MLKAMIDFELASIRVRAGEVVKPGTFERDQVNSLLAKGWVVEINPVAQTKPQGTKTAQKAVKETKK